LRIALRRTRRAQLRQAIQFVDALLHLHVQIRVLQRDADLTTDIQQQRDVGWFVTCLRLAADEERSDRAAALENRHTDPGVVAFSAGPATRRPCRQSHR